MVAVGAIGPGDDRHFRMVDQVLADTRQVDDAVDPVPPQLIRRPDADSMSNCGVTSAPAATMTSTSAKAVCSLPAAFR
jgi:hypothetical protein